VALTFTLQLHAQEEHVHGPWCTTHKDFRDLAEKYPQLLDAEKAYNKAVMEKMMQKDGVDEVLTIPVVFHVLHDRGPENISDEQIFDAVNMLNDHFSKSSADTAQVIPEFKDIHANINVQFRLANKAPDGSCTNGINRIATALTDDDRTGRTKFEQWPRHVYLNIWVVRAILSGDNSGFTLGYATLPPGVDEPFLAPFDGIVVLNTTVGTIGTANPSWNTTITHEVGHFLNLFHPWGNGPIGMECGDDDVEDTPQTEGRFGCPSPAQATICQDGVVENYQNYMDYSSCTFMFTEGQKARMRATLDLPVAGRSFLITPAAHEIAGIDQEVPQTCFPSVDFFPSKYYACIGGQVQFIPSIDNASVDTYSWSFTDASQSTSNESNPTVSFTSSGWKSVTLTAGNSAGNDTRTRQWSIYIYNPEESLEAGQIFEQDFINEDSFGGWTIRPANQNSLVENVNWSWSPIGCLDPGSFKVNLFDGSVPETYRFVTPKLNLEGKNGQFISFKYAYATQFDPSFVDVNLTVISTSNCGNTVVPRLNIDTPEEIITGGNFTGVAFEPNNPALWRTASFQISTGQAVDGVQYEFILEADYGVNNFYIDNFTVGSTLVSVEDEGALSSTKLFPNPAKDFAQLEIVLNQFEKVGVRIFDITGKQVQIIQSQMMTAGKNTIRIDTGNLSAGMYTVTVQTGEQNRSLKLMVQP
jgi:PKD repeat protein